MSRRVRAVMAVTMVVATSVAAEAYLVLATRVGNRVIERKWDQFPVRYFITNRSAPGVSAGSLETTVARAFGRWTALEGVQISSQFAGFVAAEPGADDGASVIGFQLRDDLDRVLGATDFTIDMTTGRIIESDIFLNTNVAWSVASAGEANRYDVESIAVHEIGHMLGLGHSMLGETELQNGGRRSILGKAAAMFPIAYPPGNIEDRTLKPDDIAGLGAVYGTPDHERTTGAVAGRVTRNGTGVFGAHVTAFSPSTGQTVATFTLNDRGDFVIEGLTPGLYIVRAEPLDDADAESFFGDDVTVATNFKPAYYERIVAVPAGGAGRSVEVKVPAR